VFLTPPEKLVFEVRASGGYNIISWNKGANFIPEIIANELVNFHEIFFREPTTASDYGTYEVIYSGQIGGQGAMILVVPTSTLNKASSVVLVQNLTVSASDLPFKNKWL